ncbi:MAG TPA: hypothetical protein VGO29_07120 [Solirubrobacteraceae bacterium]|jgi:hypothetical protein|nr:hypothetical protein [Solirubrobacteraceae bacterium]
MHIWTDLLARELALFVILLALGSGPAAYLSGRFDPAARFALAPVLGFCLGTCATTTLVEFVPAGKSYWVVLALALASMGLAVRRYAASRASATSRRGLGMKGVAQLAAVCLAVAGPLTYTLHQRHTVGPAAYYFTDVDNFVAEQDGAQTESIATARAAWTDHAHAGKKFSDLTRYQWAFLAHFDANLDATPLDANVNALLGLGATETFSPFLVVLLLMGALAAFAAVRYATRSRTWMSVLAGALIGGPVFIELWFDTFQAAITALGLVIPFALLGSEVLRSRRVPNLLLLALISGALLSVYSLFIPMIAVTAVVVLAWRAHAIRRSGAELRPLVKPVATRIGVLIVLAALLNLVGLTRDVHYFQAILRNQVPLPRVSYHLPVEIMPGWLLQTREFWNLSSLGTADFKQLVLGAFLPVVFLVFIAIGVRRHRPALALVALAGVCALTAEYSYASREACTYCAERDLLPVVPILIVLLTLGLSMFLGMPRRRARLVGAIGVVLVVVSVGQRARVELQRFSDSAYFLDSANRSVLDHVPDRPRAIQMEGYGESVSAQAEQPLVHHLLDERFPGKVSIALGSNLYNGTEYLNFGVPESPGPAFDPTYDYVLTRLAGVDTDRQVVVRSGPIALERRTRALDVLTYSGIEVPLARLDSSGTAWVQTALPLLLYVVGPSHGPTWVKLTFRSNTAVSLAPGSRARARRHGDNLVTCVPVTGTAPVRQAAVQVAAPAASPPIPPEEFPPVVPQESVALSAMQAVEGSCVA